MGFASLVLGLPNMAGTFWGWACFNAHITQEFFLQKTHRSVLVFIFEFIIKWQRTLKQQQQKTQTLCSEISQTQCPYISVSSVYLEWPFWNCGGLHWILYFQFQWFIYPYFIFYESRLISLFSFLQYWYSKIFIFIHFSDLCLFSSSFD